VEDEDIYRRGVKGKTPYERARQYVILEFPYKSQLVSDGILELTDYEILRKMLEGILLNLSKINVQNDQVQLHDEAQPSESYITFLLDVLKIWSNVYAEVRIHKAFVPQRIYEVQVIWDYECGWNKSEGPCEVCSRFDIGEILWDYDNKTTYYGKWKTTDFWWNELFEGKVSPKEIIYPNGSASSNTG